MENREEVFSLNSATFVIVLGTSGWTPRLELGGQALELTPGVAYVDPGLARETGLVVLMHLGMTAESKFHNG